jgi:TonB-linked SusC/RagA family outer membrane protein
MKNFLLSNPTLQKSVKKHFRIMKLYVVLSMSAIMYTGAIEVHSQSAKVTISAEQTTLADVFYEMEQQTGYMFFYNRTNINAEKRVDVDVKDKPVKEVLDENLDENVEYKMLNKHIILSRKGEGEVVNIIQQATKRITGTVVDQSGEPLTGATIIEKGTQNGTTTDADGRFTLNVAANPILQVTYIGYVSQEIAVGNQTNLQITLAEDSQALEEVVVVGYGTVSKKDLTGSVSSIDNRLIAKQATANVSQALRGQIPGLSVQQTSGKAGATSTVVLRGQSAIGKTVQPLVIIDGMPADWTIFNNLNPADIERLDVLKDASSTAIYGSRASGGVVIVTTKSGKEGKNVISYDGYYGVKTMTHMPDMKNAQELYQMWQDGVRYNGVGYAFGPDEQEYVDAGIDTDWVDMVTRNGMQNSHNLSVSGGNKSETHFMSVGYYQANGNQKSDAYERYSLNLKATGTLFDKLSTGASVYASYSEEIGGGSSILETAYRLRPWGNPKNDDGSDRFFPTATETFQTNPLFDLKNTYNERKRFSVNGNVFLEFKPVDGLALKSNFMPAYYGERYGSYTGEYVSGNMGIAGTSTSSVENIWQLAYTWENTIAFNKAINDHSIGVTGLFSIESGNRENYNAGVKDITYDNEYWYNLAASTSITGLTSGLNKTVLESYMFRVNYGFKDKYLVTLTGRWDGSSKLAPGRQWGFFPSTAIAWRAGEEQFIKDLNIFSNLKFRLSYGIAGNNAVNAYASWPTLSTTIYDFDGAAAKGAAASMANKALTWEKSHEYNLGIDMGFFGERLTTTVDLYQKTTKDIILSQQIPSHQGVTTLNANVGSVLNKGIEVSVSSVNIRTVDFSWTTSLNFAANHNEILDLYGDKNDDIGNKRFIGQPVNVNYDYKSIGIWQLDEADEAAKYGERPGQVKRWDKGEDGKFTPEDDQVILGNPFPKWTGGITNSFTYKNLDFSFFVYTRQGEQALSSFHVNFAQEFNTRYNVLDVPHWTPENPTNKWWASLVGGGSYSTYKDASFLRVGNITLGYRLSPDLLRHARISNLRIYMTATNPFLFTKYEGWDPEWAATGAASLPINNATYMIGTNITFKFFKH